MDIKFVFSPPTMKGKFTQWWSIFPPISTRWTTTYYHKL